MKVSTSFGEVYIEAEYSSEERCIMDGYEFVEQIKEGSLYVTGNNNDSFALVRGE